MFWDTKDPPSHNIEILLESPDTKVEVFLEEDNIIQECKTLKKNIVNYFTRPDVVRRMIELITTEPPEEVSMSERFRHANVACEILTMGLPSLDEKLLADRDTLNLLYSYLENEPPLNPLLASFFSKTFSMLFTKKSDQDWFLYQQTCLQLLEYLKMKSNFLDLICKHFTTPIVPCLIMEMMQNVEGSELKRNLYKWLVNERLVEKLIEIIGDPEQSEKHANVADFFCDLIHQGRTLRQDLDTFEPVFEGSDPILQKIESAATLLALFNVILQPNAIESAIVSGITVVLKIIRPTRMTDERNMDRLLNSLEREKEFHDEFLTTVIRVIEPQLKQFNELLKNPPKKPDIVTSAAKLSPPFGMARLQIVRLFSELLETKNDEISKAICETDFVETAVALFKEYCWNNFLHTEVEKCLHNIFPHTPPPPINTAEVVADATQDSSSNGKNNSLEEMLNSVLDINFFDKFDLLIKKPIPGNTPSAIQIHVIVNCKIISKLIECWQCNKDIESAGKGRRLGYMGHLINIFKYITESISESEHIGALIEDNLKDDEERAVWQSIINANDGELTKALSEQRKLLANHEPCEHNVSLDFFTDNNISDAFNGLCTLMDSSDADVIFTLDYNTQNDDHEYDDDDGDDDYNNINNDNNEGKDKDQRNDDAKNALNLFQFGRSNDDEEGDEDDNNVAASFDGDGGLSFYVEPHVNPFDELDDMMREVFVNMKADKSTESFADFESICFANNASTSNTNAASNAAVGTPAMITSSSEAYDNNANVEKSSPWSGQFTSFQIPQKDSKFSANFMDEYEDDDGMWTKPFGTSASSTTTVEQSEMQSVEPTNQTGECKTNQLTNGPSTLEESDQGPKESALNQLNDSIEDNTLVDQTAEDIITSNENREEVTKEINSELNIKQAEDHEEDTTFKHKSHALDAEAENTTKIININTNTNEETSTATPAEEISDGSTTATATT